MTTPRRALPWTGTPLMLAPMQGVTNRVVRRLFVERVRPDVVFTEFMRVSHSATGARLSASDLKDAKASEQDVPLVVQLIGRDRQALIEAAREAQAAGALHLNLNLGCPAGRMNPGSGGGMLEHPEHLQEVIPALREAVAGTFSVKVRAGWDDPEQVFSLLPLFESAGVDFLVLHPRTVQQAYTGEADHRITARVVQATRLPVIANGDVRTAEQGRRVLAQTGAAGLMLGRGAIADPLLFERLRGKAPERATPSERDAMLRSTLGDLASRYGQLFSGDAHVLANLKTFLALVSDGDEELAPAFKKLRRAKTTAQLAAALNQL
ncbi:MAG: tRNA-dihydrouridine synthase family protein [Myxococcales bacterium]